jgi:hypothetical protein
VSVKVPEDAALADMLWPSSEKASVQPVGRPVTAKCGVSGVFALLVMVIDLVLFPQPTEPQLTVIGAPFV